MGLVAPQHVGSSRTRAQTCVPCTGRQILNHGTTREVPPTILITIALYYSLKSGSVVSSALFFLKIALAFGVFCGSIQILRLF